MKKTAALFALVLAVGMTAALDAEAKRLGGGKSAGMQRQNVTAPAGPGATPNQLPGSPTQLAPAAG
ncbi:MAG TPA: Tim44 domain-containing protein, partial [Ramlibacter sp.]|nr:Tim44 domain-containing protein [Ramlibacter sp.]